LILFGYTEPAGSLMKRTNGKILRVSQMARAVGCHPNTVRLYEGWGFLPRIPRNAAGYRLYSQCHLEQMALARTVLPGPFPGGGAPVWNMVRAAARGRYAAALEEAARYRMNVLREERKARAVLVDLGRWARSAGRIHDRPVVFSRRRAARTLGITIDALRTWERNGLLRVGKDRFGYCEYSQRDLARIRIINALRAAGYSLAAVRRMFVEYDRGTLAGTAAKALAAVLDTPDPDAPIVYVTDRWLSLLAEHKKRAARAVRMITARCDGGTIKRKE
jgi:DNA-binding transcriptional MerR regulator